MRTQKTLKEQAHRLLTRILKREKHATLSHIVADLNASSKSISVETGQRISNYMDFQNRSSTRVRCRLLDTKLYASLGFANITKGLFMTANTLLWLKSLISNCIGRIDVREDGENLMNPWTLHLRRKLFEQMEILWWYRTYAFGVKWELTYVYRWLWQVRGA